MNVNKQDFPFNACYHVASFELLFLFLNDNLVAIDGRLAPLGDADAVTVFKCYFHDLF